MTVPGCRTVCPPRSVRFTYSGGDCSVPGLGAPASPNCSEKRVVRHTTRTGPRSGNPDRPPARAERRAATRSNPRAVHAFGVAAADAIVGAGRAVPSASSLGEMRRYFFSASTYPNQTVN